MKIFCFLFIFNVFLDLNYFNFLNYFFNVLLRNFINIARNRTKCVYVIQNKIDNHVIRRKYPWLHTMLHNMDLAQTRTRLSHLL